MKFSLPLLKFIGDTDMVVPITSRGQLLSNPEVMNYYYPETIRLIDANGSMYTYQKVEISGRIHWGNSLRYLSILRFIQPILSTEPSAIPLEAFKELVSEFIGKTQHSRQLPETEKDVLISQLNRDFTHREIIDRIVSLSYWR